MKRVLAILGTTAVLAGPNIMVVRAACELYDILPTPVVIEAAGEDPKLLRLQAVLKRLGCEQENLHHMAHAILDCGNKISVDPVLIAVLMKTESNFDMSAESEKGYVGLMQTPFATKRWADVDILLGCRILEEKLKRTGGNLTQALALYKGGNNPLAKRQAAVVLAIYKEIINDSGRTGEG